MIVSIKPFGQAHLASRGGNAPRMRPLTWRELKARLEGARKLRPQCAGAGAPGSFDPAAACRIALLDHGNHPVNRAGLGNLKTADGTDGSVTAVCNSTI